MPKIFSTNFRADAPRVLPIAALGVLFPFGTITVVRDQIEADDIVLPPSVTIRFGPWFRVNAPLRHVARAFESPSDTWRGGPLRLTNHLKDERHLQIRTAAGPFVTIEFTQTILGEWLVRANRRGLWVNTSMPLRRLSLTPGKPEALMSALD